MVGHPSTFLSTPSSSPLLSDAFPDDLDLDFCHVNLCTSEPPSESPPRPQPMTGLADDVDGSKDTPNANVDPDAKEMVAFWPSMEAFLASSSSDSTATATAKGTGAMESGQLCAIVG